MADITIRALQTLGAADAIYCEDTRQTKKLLLHYGIEGWLEIYNDHNAGKMRPKILEALSHNKMIALVTDAGTPLVSDPGYKLVREVLDAGYKVIPVPGASAMLAGLVAAGLPSDQFHFAGFVDDKKFTELALINSTIIFYESPKRVVDTLRAMEKFFKGRTAVVARELTKIYEEFKSGSFAELYEYYSKNEPRGEIVILLSPPEKQDTHLEDIEAELKELLKDYKLKEASEILATKYGISKKAVYEHGVRIKNN